MSRFPRAVAWHTLLGHAWRRLWREGRVLPAVAILVLALGAALWLSAERHQAFERDRQAAEATDQHTFLSQGPRNPHSVAHFSRFAFRPLPPTLLLDPGILDYAGAAVWMEAHAQDPANVRLAEDRVDLGRLAELNVAWVFQVLVPLLLLALGFDTVAGERDRGTWSLLLASGTSIPRWVAAQTLALWLPLVAILFTVATVPLLEDSATGGGWDRLARALSWTGAHVLYLAAWAVLIVLISWRATNARHALVLLLGVWALLTLAVPRLAATIADQLAPMPSTTAFTAAVREDLSQGLDGHAPAAERDQAFERAVLARYGVTKVEDLPVSFAGLALQEGEEYGNQVYDRHFGALSERLQRQSQWRRAFALLSPLPALQHVSTAAAGTGLDAHLDFVAQAESSRRNIVRFLNDDMTRNGTGGDGGPKDFDYLADPALWARTPQFVYRPPAWHRDAQAHGWDAALLLLWLLIPVAALALAVKREER